MAWQELKYRLMSDCPMLVHNGQTADPLNKWSKAMKAINSKRKKTDADYEEIARLEFFAGLYMGQHGPVIPAPNVDAMLIAAAKQNRQGPLAKSGLYCAKDADMLYDGPRTAEAMWKEERFRHTAIVRIGMSKVVRMRPIFRSWSTVVTLQTEDTVVNAAQVDEWMFIAGRQIGLGDWRPQHGRFSVERVSDDDMDDGNIVHVDDTMLVARNPFIREK